MVTGSPDAPAAAARLALIAANDEADSDGVTLFPAHTSIRSGLHVQQLMQ